MITIRYVQHNNVILPQQHQHTVIMFTHILHICLTSAYYAALAHVHLNQQGSPLHAKRRKQKPELLILQEIKVCIRAIPNEEKNDDS